MYPLLPCAHVAGEGLQAPSMKAYQAIVIVVVYAFVTWMIFRGFAPSTALITAAGALAVSMTSAGLIRYRTAIGFAISRLPWSPDAAPRSAG